MEIIGIIPARRGSKGIKNKNIKRLNEKPLIQYSISQALKSNITRVIVNTEDPKIASMAKSFGAEIPFLRPKKLADDISTNFDVIKDTIDFFRKQSYFPDIVLLLQPTSPFRTKDIINKSISLLKTKKVSSVISVKKVKEHPDIMLKKYQRFLKPISKDFLKHSKRQSRSPLFVPSGVVYTFWANNIKKYASLYGPKIHPFLIDDEKINIDIDSPFDFFIAEMTAKHWNRNKNKFN